MAQRTKALIPAFSLGAIRVNHWGTTLHWAHWEEDLHQCVLIAGGCCRAAEIKEGSFWIDFTYDTKDFILCLCSTSSSLYGRKSLLLRRVLQYVIGWKHSFSEATIRCKCRKSTQNTCFWSFVAVIIWGSYFWPAVRGNVRRTKNSPLSGSALVLDPFSYLWSFWRSALINLCSKQVS